MKFSIQSQNPYLLDILHKNPDSALGLYLKPLKNGVIVGNCVSAHQYDVCFLDHKYSYGYEDNQIDFMSFVHPDALMHEIHELFNHLLKSRTEYLEKPIDWLSQTYQEVDTHPCTITVPFLWMDNRYYRDESFLLSRYIPSIQLQAKGVYLFELTITADTVFDALNLLALVAFFLSLTNQHSDTYKGDENLIEKYVRVLTNIKETPYFIYYLFIKRCCNYSSRLFSILKEPLEQALLEHQGLQVSFSPYDTQRSRIAFIKEHVNKEQTILDFGCGELAYFKALYKDLDVPYVAYDKENFEAIANGLKRNTGFESLLFTQDLEAIPTSETYSVILSEVVEHNTTEEARAILEDLKTRFTAKQWIITTPNSEFNVFYALQDRMRHEDHKIEYTRPEFEDFISSIFDTTQFTLNFLPVGDVVNGIPTTQAVIIQPIN